MKAEGSTAIPKGSTRKRVEMGSILLQLERIKIWSDLWGDPELFRKERVRSSEPYRTRNVHTYVEGLKDLGGALSFNANLTDDLVTFWSNLLSAYDSAAAEGKAMWFAVVHPKLANATYFTGDPAGLGLNEAEVGGMAETTLYITPLTAPVVATKPTITTATTT